MERPTTANISYKGSVSDAIAETQRQKKLFVVYISGDDTDSTHLEQSVWADNKVAVSISKYCIFLHLVQGSVDALQFSAIYPQKSVPSITAVGYNGLKLWQHEGYTSVENFVANIEKAWASLHLQETTITLLTQALASKKPEILGSNLQIAGESTSTSNNGSSSTAKMIGDSEDKSANDSKPPEQETISETVEDNDKMPRLQTSLQSSTAVEVKREPKVPQSSRREENVGNVTTDMHSSLVSRDIDIYVIPKETKEGSSEVNTMANDEKTKNEEVSEPVDCSNVVKSIDINLNIRMPDGASLKRKFMITDTLRSVKQYVDENKGCGISSYDLAIPYPRKVFAEQDMDIVLSELGFAARQALIVVPHRQAKIPPLTSNPQHSTSMVDSTDDNNGGYFALLKRALSFVNPFSYLGGNTNSSNFEPAPHTLPAQSNNYQYQPYRPNDALQGRLLSGTASSSRSSGQTQTNHSSASQSTAEIRRRTSRPFGSNIHTLKHDEDDLQSKDNNTFWNGNSTQYGGDDKK